MPFLDITPQERLALVVLALLLTGGTVARRELGRKDRALALEFSAELADTLSPTTSGGLRAEVEGELAESRVRSQPLAPGEKIDPNTATAVQLDRLPGIGPALAERIVAHRASRGRFRSLDDLGAVSGIGDALLGRIAGQVTLGAGPPSAGRAAAERPLDLNRATAAELQELPGVGPAIADRIIDYRERNGSFRKWEDLENVAGIGPRLRERLQAAARLGP